MESDEDELYEPEESSPQDTSNESINPVPAKDVKMEELEEGEEEGDDDEEIEEDDSDSVWRPSQIGSPSNG